MGAKEYGIYAYAVSLAQLLTVPAVFGLNTLLVREVSRYLALGDAARLKGLLLWARRVLLVSSVGIAILFVLALWLREGVVSNDTTKALAGSALLIPILSFLLLWQGGLQGLGRVVEAQIPQFFVLPGIFLLLSVLAYMLIGLSGAMAVGLRIIAGGISLFVSFLLFKKYLPYSMFVGIVPLYEYKSWMRSAIPLLFVGTGGLLNQKMSIVMVGSIVGAEAAGIFDVAMKASILVNFTQLVLSWPFSPAAASLHARSESKELQRLVTRVWVMGMTGSIFIVFVYLIFGEQILFAFGEEFSKGFYILVVLALSQMISVIFGPVVPLLNMSGLEIEAAKGVAIGFFVNVLAGYFLTMIMGAIGTALALQFSLFVSSAFLWYSAIRDLGINTCPLFFWVKGK